MDSPLKNEDTQIAPSTEVTASDSDNHENSPKEPKDGGFLKNLALHFYEDNIKLTSKILESEVQSKKIEDDVKTLKLALEEASKENVEGGYQKKLVQDIDDLLQVLEKKAKQLTTFDGLAEAIKVNLERMKFPGSESQSENVENEAENDSEELRKHRFELEKSIENIQNQKSKINELLDSLKQSDRPKYRVIPDEDINFELKKPIEVAEKISNVVVDNAKKLKSFNKDVQGFDLKKEDVMKYMNDPFWSMLRWLLFLGFWFAWAIALIASISIAIYSHKCSMTNETSKWWESSPIVVFRPSDVPYNGFTGLVSNLKILSEQKVMVVSLDNFLQQSDDGFTKDFKNINAKMGILNDLKKFVKVAKQRGQRVVLELDPNHSSSEHPWFQRSANRDSQYDSHYIWHNGKPKGRNLTDPPNNWVSVSGGSAWKFNERRQQYYFHQFNENQPDLNYESPAVIEDFSDVLKTWMNQGISGFRLADTNYLIEDLQFEDEEKISRSDPQSYDSLLHTRTKDRLENIEIIKKWKHVVEGFTHGDGFFAIKTTESITVNSEYNSELLNNIPLTIPITAVISNPLITGDKLHENISMLLSQSTLWTGLDWTDEKINQWRQDHPQITESLILMSLLLPATPILTFNDTIIAKEAFLELAKARLHPAALRGESKTYSLNNGTVFMYRRSTRSSLTYVVVYNSGDYLEVVNLWNVMPYMPKEVNILAHSSNYKMQTVAVKKGKMVRTTKMHFSPKSTAVFKFS